jgi:hypothetical protein
MRDVGETDTDGTDGALGVRWRPLGFDVEIGVEGTVVLMTVLVVALDDGIGDFGDAAGLVVGPLVATFAARFFAAVLARVSRPSAPPATRTEIRGLARHTAQYLLLGVVPVIVVVIGGSTGAYTPEEAVDGVIWLGLGFLVLLGGIGGYRARRSVWSALLGALAAGVVGLFVLLLRLVLEH